MEPAPKHQQHAAEARELQRRITAALDRRDYKLVIELSARLQAVVRRAMTAATEVKPAT
jgi:hypothetical protein